MSNVVSINGEKVIAPGETSEELVTRLEELLERAKSGDIHGIHAIVVHRDESITTCRTLIGNYRSIGAVTSMLIDMVKEM